MKTCEEKTRSVFNRIEEEKKIQQKQRRTVTKIAAPILSLCLVAVLGVGIWQSGLLRQSPMQTEDSADTPSGGLISDTNALTTDKKNNNPNDFSVIWANDVNPAAENVEGFSTWKNCDTVSYRLYEALESGNNNDVFAILARPAIDYNFEYCNFEYKGKTLGDYYSAMCDEQNLPEKLRQLLMEGDSLKYGEALYKTGTPTGEKWYQSLYEEHIAFYGSAILERYIVDGQFLAEEVKKDIEIATNSTQATDAYKKAFTAYLEWLATFVHGVLPSEAVSEKFGIIIYLTKDEFSAFINNFDDDIDTAGWIFDLATNDDDVELFGVDVAVNE